MQLPFVSSRKKLCYLMKDFARWFSPSRSVLSAFSFLLRGTFTTHFYFYSTINTAPLYTMPGKPSSWSPWSSSSGYQPIYHHTSFIFHWLCTASCLSSLAHPILIYLKQAISFWTIFLTDMFTSFLSLFSSEQIFLELHCVSFSRDKTA